MSRRHLLELGTVALLAPKCATTRRPVRTVVDSPRVAAWNKALTVEAKEVSVTVAPGAVDGVVPDALRGARALWNGPAMLALGGRLAHPFDGHGYVRDFRFTKEGGVELVTRFVDTEAFRAERSAGRLVHRGLATLPFDPSEDGGAAKNREAPPYKNVANTTLTPFAGKLLAGWEGGPPHALDPATLQTMGVERFGVLGEREAFLAHTRLDRRRGVLVGLSPAPGRVTTLRFREIGPDFVERVSTEVTLDAASFVHDFVITERFYVLALNPLSVNLFTYFSMTRGNATLMDMLSTAPEKARAVVLVPRPPASARGAQKAEPIAVATPAPVFAVHYGQAFDDGDSVVLDVCAFEDFTFGNEFGFTGQTSPLDPSLPDERKPQRLVRLTLSPQQRTSSVKVLSRYGIDFPRVHPDLDGVKAPFLVAATRADVTHSDPFDSVLTLDLDDLERPEAVWTTPGDTFMGEPLLVPTPGGGPTDAHVVCCVSDPSRDRTDLLVFDAKALTKGPVARASVPLQPYAFHGVALPA
ncbi:MAG: carotenoid oxygenase family protein [Myxococcaceae bacterium]|nr:carotenoid oxygenase family protein [Myxococcaceae bacterium]